MRKKTCGVSWLILIAALTMLCMPLVGCATQKTPWGSEPVLIAGENVTVLGPGDHTVTVPAGERRWLCTAEGLYRLAGGR